MPSNNDKTMEELLSELLAQCEDKPVLPEKEPLTLEERIEDAHRAADEFIEQLQFSIDEYYRNNFED